MDLQDVRVASLEKPDGWVTFDISSEPNDDGDGLCVLIFRVCGLSHHSQQASLCICPSNHRSRQPYEWEGYSRSRPSYSRSNRVGFIPNHIILDSDGTALRPLWMMIHFLSRHHNLKCTRESANSPSYNKGPRLISGLSLHTLWNTSANSQCAGRYA
jgi:hypothetical protein